MTGRRLERSLTLGADGAEAFFDAWAPDYEDDMRAAGYAAPDRAADALCRHGSYPWAPLADLGCGSGLAGAALAGAGFSCIDGFDISRGMLDRAADKGVYRHLSRLDLSRSLDSLQGGDYCNAAAVGVLHPALLPAHVIDRVMAFLPVGGCFVFSLNDEAARGGAMKSRVFELCEYRVARPLLREDGPHLPGLGIRSTVYILEKC